MNDPLNFGAPELDAKQYAWLARRHTEETERHRALAFAHSRRAALWSKVAGLCALVAFLSAMFVVGARL